MGVELAIRGRPQLTDHEAHALATLLAAMRTPAPLDLVCECARPGCFVNVLISAADFAALSAEGGAAVVAPGHGEREAVVRREPGYDVLLVPTRQATPWDELLQRICHPREAPLGH